MVPVLTRPRGCTLGLVLFRQVALYSLRRPFRSSGGATFARNLLFLINYFSKLTLELTFCGLTAEIAERCGNQSLYPGSPYAH